MRTQRAGVDDTRRGLPTLEQIAAAAIPAPYEIAERRISDDWRERRLADYREQAIAQRLVIRPAWAPAPDSGLIDISVADTGAFGVGAHPTTRACLELLFEVAPAGTFADLGCGTGVLAILASRLGWAPVIALDFQPASVEGARENAARNGATLDVRLADLVGEPPPAAAGFAANVGPEVHAALASRWLRQPPLTGLVSGFGVAEAEQVMVGYGARATPPSAEPPASAHFLKESSKPSRGGVDRIVIQKLDSALATLEHKLSTKFETTHKLNQTFLKIKSANTEFLKIKSANTDFLKIDDANANFLKIDDANANFLKIDDANSEFLKVDSTAANSSELGGLAPAAFFQGNGHVVTGSIPSLPVSNTPTHLLSLPGGIIVVSVASTVGGALQVVIDNATGATLDAVAQSGGEHSLAANTDTSIAVTLANSGGQLQLQIFLNGQAFPDVVTLIVSAEDAGGVTQVVGQAFTGAA